MDNGRGPKQTDRDTILQVLLSSEHIEGMSYLCHLYNMIDAELQTVIKRTFIWAEALSIYDNETWAALFSVLAAQQRESQAE